jgi:cell filamentation protein
MSDYEYEYEVSSNYCYPNSHVLINKLGVTNAIEFMNAERDITSISVLEVSEKPIKGRFDLAHLMAIHRAIFGDIFDWAGKLRTVNIAKGNPFCQSAYLVDYADDLFAKLKAEKYLVETPAAELPERLAYYLSEINVLHPFREGNGRVQRMFIDYLARYNGHHLDYSDITDTEMIEASVLAFDLDYTALNTLVKRIITSTANAETTAFRKLLRPKN